MTAIERVNNFYALVGAILRPFWVLLVNVACALAAVLLWLAIAMSVVLVIGLPIAGLIFFFLALQCVAVGVCP